MYITHTNVGSYTIVTVTDLAVHIQGCPVFGGVTPLFLKLRHWWK